MLLADAEKAAKEAVETWLRLYEDDQRALREYLEEAWPGCAPRRRPCVAQPPQLPVSSSATLANAAVSASVARCSFEASALITSTPTCGNWVTR
jgi:hypothetical protein